MNVVWAAPQEAKELQQYLDRAMGKLPYERWANILDARWNVDKHRYAITLRDHGHLCGYVGMIDVERNINGEKHRIANLTSFYVDKEFRGQGYGQKMMAAVTDDPSITYTVYSANNRSGPLLEKIGWQIIEETRCFWHRPALEPQTGITIKSGDIAVAADLLDHEAKMLNHHAGLNVMPHILHDNDGNRCFVVSYEKYKGEAVLHHEILHLDDREVFSKYITDYAYHALPTKSAVLSVESRFLTAAAVPDWREQLECKRYMKPAADSPPINPEDLDLLYGEVVLLDLKLY